MTSVSTVGQESGGEGEVLPSFVLYALIASVLVSFVAGTAGVFAVLRGVSFLIAGAAHAALGGATIALILATQTGIPFLPPIVGALLMALAMALATGYAGGRGITARMETAISVFFALSLCLAVAAISLVPSELMSQVWGLLLGDILLLTEQDVLILTVATLVVISLISIFFKEFTYICFDMEGAAAFGMRVHLYNYLLLSLIATSTVIATKAIGAIVVYAMMTAPAATALLHAKSIERAIILATALSLLYLCTSLLISLTLVNIAPGALAGVLAAVVYLISLTIKRARRRIRE